MTRSERTRGPAGGQTIVVGVDGSEHARLALKWASDEALLRGVTLRILCATARHPKDLPGWYKGDTEGISPGEAVVEDALGLVATRHPSVVARGEALEWPGALALIDASAGSDLLVLGARGSGGFKELLLGSVSHQCVEHAHCPVVVVHGRSDDPIPSAADRRIVVGIDGSEGGDRALEWALAEARLRDAAVKGVFAWHLNAIAMPTTDSTEPYEAAAREITDRATALAKEWAPGVRFAAVSQPDAAAPALVDLSVGAGLLVVGSRGLGGFRGMLLGSVARQCADHGQCPVVVVRPPVDDRPPVGGFVPGVP
jgi:nucleotide-binding universal stress UspA family protein